MTGQGARLTLYGAPLSPYSMRNIMQIAIKGLPIDVVEPPGGLGSAEYREINPIGKIPALVVDGHILPESAVIAEYLEERFPQSPLLPSDAWQRACVRLAIRLVDTYVMDAMLPVFGHLDPSSRDETVVESTLQNVRKGLGYLDRFIKGPYAAGGTLTLADCAAVPVLAYCEYFFPLLGAGEPLSDVVSVCRYWQAVCQDRRIGDAVEKMTGAVDKALGR